MSTCLVHIVPHLPPNLSGVGDYATILGRRIAEQTEGHVKSVYVQAGCSGGDAPTSTLESADLAGQLSASALVEAVATYTEEADRKAALLHYVGYGYQARGCPMWLLYAWRRLQKDQPRLNRLTMFHELYATSYKPWTSAFWTSPIQKYIALHIARLSDGLMTNRDATAARLRKHIRGKTTVRVSPTFSNVGEPDHVLPYEDRIPQAVVFGASSRRADLYRQHGNTLARALRYLDVEHIIDIGSPVSESLMQELSLPVRACGRLPAASVGRYLRNSSVGVLRYSLAAIAKSGIMAAYMAHGVLPLLACGGDAPELSHLQEGRHFLPLDSCTRRALPSASKRATIAQNVQQRYNKHVHSRHAARVVRTLWENSNTSSFDSSWPKPPRQ